MHLTNLKSLLFRCLSAANLVFSSDAPGTGPLEYRVAVLGLNRVDVGPRRPRYDVHDALDLVEGRRAGEERLAEQELAEDAAHRPHVHALCVPGKTSRGCLQSPKQTHFFWQLNWKTERYKYRLNLSVSAI